MVLIITLNKLWILPPALDPLSLHVVGAEDVEVVGYLVGTALQVQRQVMRSSLGTL